MKTQFSLLLLFLSFTLLAQLNPRTKWGDVSQAEIDYKEVSFEQNAPAVILYEKGKTEVMRSFQTYVYRRIKILNENGIEAANQEIMYYADKGLESIGSLKAQTINFENGKKIVLPVDKKEIFDVKKNDYYNTLKFTFPDVKVGSIIEFEYTLTNQNLYLIDAWRFQHDLPTLYSSYEIENRSTLDYTSLAIGDKIVQYSQNNPKTQKWTLTNLPGHNSMNFLYNKEDMAERIVFQLRGYRKRANISYEADRYENVLANWKDLNQEMNNHFKAYQNESFTREIANSIPNGSSQKETLENIYDYFRKNYRWNNFYSIQARQSNRDLAKSKVGNSTDLNLMLNSILNNKGFTVDLVLISTRDHGKIIASYPYLNQFNVVLNLVHLEDGTQFLIDASDMRYDLGYAPLRDYNHYALIVDPLTERMVSFHPMLSEFQSTQNYVFREGKFIQTRTDKVNGYFKEFETKSSSGQSVKSPVENSLDILLNETRYDKRDSETDNFQLRRIVSESPEINSPRFIGIENPLKNILNSFQMREVNRNRALEFNFPFHYKTIVILDIPEGYNVEIPENFNTHHHMINKEFQYLQNAEIKDGKLQVQYDFFLGKAVYEKNYLQIKSFFDKSISSANQNILLRKN